MQKGSIASCKRRAEHRGRFASPADASAPGLPTPSFLCKALRRSSHYYPDGSSLPSAPRLSLGPGRRQGSAPARIKNGHCRAGQPRDSLPESSRTSRKDHSAFLPPPSAPPKPKPVHHEEGALWRGGGARMRLRARLLSSFPPHPQPPPAYLRLWRR